jgi:3-phenylpropionate/trans-cinnamate dioxygenase ferredoxin subunit
MIEATFQPLIPLADIGVGRMRSCKVGEREVVVCHTKDGVFTVDNVCTHAFARMSEGYLKGTRITCPLHGASFDVRTGRVLGGPATLPLATFETRVTAGQVEIALPTEAGAR